MNNPFTSQTFTKIWCKHFNNSKPGIRFESFKNVSFVKTKPFSYFSNVGQKLTNGIPYSLSKNDSSGYKNKVFLIRDIPSYLNVSLDLSNSKLKLKKVQQYEGYLTEISKYDNLEHYMTSTFKSNSRSKFRRNITRLEASFEIDYTMYYGEITKDEFDLVFETFYALLEKRYTDKGEPCGELDPKLWSYYCELAFAMINEKTASLFVIYNDKKPIGVTFSYHFDTTLIEALTVFDIDFYRFNIGHTTIYKMLEWSFKNGVKLFDYTQGDFQYKKRWSNTTYSTEFHVLYDSNSMYSRLLANSLVSYFNFKRRLRDKNINRKYHNLKHKLTGSTKKKILQNKTFKVEIVHKTIQQTEEMTAINLFTEDFTMQRKALYDFLYMNPEPAKDFKVFKKTTSPNIYFAFGIINSLKITEDET